MFTTRLPLFKKTSLPASGFYCSKEFISSVLSQFLLIPTMLALSIAPPDSTVNVLVLAGDRGKVVTFAPGDWLQVKLRDGSKRVGDLQLVKPGFLLLDNRRIGFESVVWFREHQRTREVTGKVLTGVGVGLTIAGLAVGSSPAGNDGAALLTAVGAGVATAGIITLATHRKYRTRDFRLLVIAQE